MEYPVVFVPGLQSDHRAWTPQIRYFVPRREVIVPADYQFEPTIAAMADVVFDQLPPRFHLVPWSMGGYIALHLLPRLRQRLASLILVATSARAETPDNAARRAAAIRLAETQGMRAAAQHSMAQGSFDPSCLDPDVCQAIIQSKVDLGLDAFRSQQSAIIHRRPTFANLPCIDAPSLIIAGADDNVVSADCAAELHQQIPGSTLHVFEQCGHYPPLEYPDRFNRLLQDWFTRQEAALRSVADVTS